MPQVHANRTALYLRISAATREDLQAEERQEHGIREWCASQGWDVRAVYADHSRSAYKVGTVHRAGFQELRTAVERGEYDRVVGAAVDRIGRNVEEYVAFVQLCQTAGVEVWVHADRHRITRTGGGLDLVGLIKAWVAEEESRIKSYRIKQKMEQKRRQGVPYTYRPIYGYRRIGVPRDGQSSLELDPVEAAVLREAYARVAAGESAYSIAKDLAGRDPMTCPAPGGHKTWRSRDVTEHLLRPRYAGYYGDLTLGTGDSEDPSLTNFRAGDWPRVVEPELWWAARSLILARRERAGKKPNAWRPQRLLAKIARCGTCSEFMWASVSDPDNRNAKYYCSGCRRSHQNPLVNGHSDIYAEGDPGRPHARVNAYHCDQVVVAATLAALRGAPEGVLEPDDDADAQYRSELIGQRQRAQERLQTAAGMFATGRITEAQLDEITDTLRKDIAQLDLQLAPRHVTSALAPFHSEAGRELLVEDVWSGLTPEQRRLVVAELWDVTLHSVGPGRWFKPECVELKPRSEGAQ